MRRALSDITRPVIFALLCAAVWPLYSAPVVPRYAWSVETSEPFKARRLDLIYGETIDLECRFRSYTSTMDLLGATVILHARTNGMAAGSSFQLAGSALPDGLATIRVSVDAWLPPGLSNAVWTLEVTQTNATRILRSGGTVSLSGSAATSANIPIPVEWLASLLADLAAHTNDSAIHLSSAQSARIASALTNESDLVAMAAIAALPPPSTDAYRLVASNATTWLDIDGRRWETIETINTNLIDFMFSPGSVIGMTFDDRFFPYHVPTNATHEVGFYDVENFGLTIRADRYWLQHTFWVGPLNPSGYDVGWLYEGVALPVTLSPRSIPPDKNQGYQAIGTLTLRYHVVSVQTNLVSEFATMQRVEQVAASIPSISGLATTQRVEQVAASIPSISGLATTQDVALAVAPKMNINGGTATNLTVSGKLRLGGVNRTTWPEEADISGKLDISNATATNLTVRGWFALPQSAATNLVLRLVASNEHIYVQEVYQ